MLFSRIDLQAELIKERQRQQLLMNDVHDLLDIAELNDRDILDRLHRSGQKEEDFTFDFNENAQVFRLEEIKNICVRYRLRFLDSKYFKADYPYEAIVRIKELEKKYSKKIEHFKIIAPDHTFNLEDINKDPILFAQINKNTFYFIHKWGNDLAWHKRISMWPFQSFKNCFISLWVAAFLFAFLLPISLSSFFGLESEIYLRTWLMIHVFIGIFGFTIGMGLMFDKTFSNLSWNSKYYNY